MTHERTDEDIIRSGLEDTLDPDYHWAALDRLVARLAQAEQERDEARAGVQPMSEPAEADAPPQRSGLEALAAENADLKAAFSILNTALDEAVRALAEVHLTGRPLRPATVGSVKAAVMDLSAADEDILCDWIRQREAMRKGWAR
jgi:hypothetical protein